jgi:hypothetical protein
MYHCMSRTVGGDFLLGDFEKEHFVRQMWRIADFLEIRVLDYAVMSNHYHQLVRTPAIVELSDEQLLEKLRVYYGERSREARKFGKALRDDAEEAQRLREQYEKRMGSLSEFEKVLKQGFSRWYNQQHDRKGTLWMERFKSVLVENTLEWRKIIAGYIDLNPVRAEMVDDPAKYRFCGYGAAMAGDKRCQKGLQEVMGMDDWEEACAKYRVYLMRRGHVEASGKKGRVSREQLLEVVDRNGHLDESELIRLRVRYFTEGLVLGSKEFVNTVYADYAGSFGENRTSGARPIQGWPDENRAVLHELRDAPLS